MVVDYSKAKVYKIYNTIDSDIYIGSTCCGLASIMSKHRSEINNEKVKHRRLYKKMNELGVENFHIVLVEEMPECQCKEQLHKKEREKIEELKPALNYAIPTRTFQEWVEDNREYVREFDRKHRQENREHHNEVSKKWRDNNPEKVKEYKKTDYDKNRDKILEKKKADFQKNKEKILTRRKQPCQCEICGKTITRCCLSRHIKTQHS